MERKLTLSHTPSAQLRPVSLCQGPGLYCLLTLVVVTLILGCGGAKETSPIPDVENVTWEPAVTYLPVMTVNTDGAKPITSKKDYVTGSYNITDSDSAALQEGTLEIKGRGNSTWVMPKKPYHVKLTSKTALLGMPKNKHWILLANFFDKTLIRNAVTFELSRMLNMEYTPRSVFVELYLNGNYRGVYQLTEHIRIDSNRINIPGLDITDTSDDLISGGYLLEVDSSRGEDFCFCNSRNTMIFCLKDPETLLAPGWEEHRNYIVNYINQTDDSIFSDSFQDPATGYEAYIDVDSAIGYYLINELLRNPDGDLYDSTYMYKKRGGKLFLGPVWDFDLAIGNYFESDAQSWHIRKAPWFTRLFKDPAFDQKVKAKWRQMKTDGVLDRLFDYIDEQSAGLNLAQQNNFSKWDMLDVYIVHTRLVTGSYEGEVSAMKEWLRERIAWMDARLSEE